MSELTTVSGDVLLIDEEDVPLLHGRRLYTLRTRKLTYATYVEKKPDGKQRSILVHRVIMAASPGAQVDHINGNGLDCRRANLRFVTHAQNQANRRSESQGSSRYRGVTHLSDPERWMARIQSARRYRLIGMFDTEVQAARAFDRAADEMWGEFARLNFPGEPLMTHDEIAAAKRTVARGASRFRGVSWDKRNKKWTVTIKAHGKSQHLGRWADEHDAARVFDRASWAAWGRLDRLNFPDEYRSLMTEYTP